jgi:hypothetical protein
VSLADFNDCAGVGVRPTIRALPSNRLAVCHMARTRCWPSRKLSILAIPSALVRIKLPILLIDANRIRDWSILVALKDHARVVLDQPAGNSLQ